MMPAAQSNAGAPNDLSGNGLSEDKAYVILLWMGYMIEETFSGCICWDQEIRGDCSEELPHKSKRAMKDKMHMT